MRTADTRARTTSLVGLAALALATVASTAWAGKSDEAWKEIQQMRNDAFDATNALSDKCEAVERQRMYELPEAQKAFFEAISDPGFAKDIEAWEKEQAMAYDQAKLEGKEKEFKWGELPLLTFSKGRNHKGRQVITGQLLMTSFGPVWISGTAAIPLFSGKSPVGKLKKTVHSGSEYYHVVADRAIDIFTAVGMKTMMHNLPSLKRRARLGGYVQRLRDWARRERARLEVK